MDGAYNGTQGSVNRPTSQKRRAPRLESVLEVVMSYGSDGATWKNVALALNIHHGQASGALSNLHKLGEVFVVREMERDGCQVYVSGLWKASFCAHQRFDEPTRTQASIQKEAIQGLVTTTEFFLKSVQEESHLDMDSMWGNWWRQELANALDNYKKAMGK